MFTSFWQNLAGRSTCHLSFLIFQSSIIQNTLKLIFQSLSNFLASLDFIWCKHISPPYWFHWTNLNWTWFLCPKSPGCLADLVRPMASLYRLPSAVVPGPQLESRTVPRVQHNLNFHPTPHCAELNKQTAQLSKDYLRWEFMNVECKSVCLRWNWSIFSEIVVAFSSPNGRGGVWEDEQKARELSFASWSWDWPRPIRSRVSDPTNQSGAHETSLELAGWALPGRAAPPPAPRKPAERRKKMAEGEINIDNIIQRLLEGEMPSPPPPSSHTAPHGLSTRLLCHPIAIESGWQMVNKFLTYKVLSLNMPSLSLPAKI